MKQVVDQRLEQLGREVFTLRDGEEGQQLISGLFMKFGNLLKLMKRAGCVGVKMGIESGVDRILKIIRKNASRDHPD